MGRPSIGVVPESDLNQDRDGNAMNPMGPGFRALNSLLKMPSGVRQLEWPARSACGAGLNPSLDSSPTESNVGVIQFFNRLHNSGPKDRVESPTAAE
jgi:hypothetical protein